MNVAWTKKLKKTKFRMETNFSKMVKRQKNKLIKEKWDKNCGIWKKIKITKKKRIR